MIVRMWRGYATAENVPRYLEHLEATVLPELRKLPGFLGVSLMQAQRGERVELIVASRWVSMAAVHAFAGSDPDQAVVEPAAKAVLSDYETSVSHYEVAFDAAGAT